MKQEPYNGAGNSLPTKKFILDSSSIITISDNCFIKVLKHLAQKENITFIIPESVYKESVLTPLNIKRFELSAIRIQDAVTDGYIQVAKTTESVKGKMQRIEAITDRLCSFEGSPLRVVHRGETETLALLKELGAQMLVIDERTTRMLIEEPSNIIRFLQKKYPGINVNKQAINEFRNEYGDIKVCRSVELIALAHENGTLEREIHKSNRSLEACLYAAKFAGCAVSFDEISKYMKRVKQ
ncbi:MAG TPA: hypothetical protein VJG83_05035 [archaeon]|nr:hypothetical protein [archaeon]